MKSSQSRTLQMALVCAFVLFTLHPRQAPAVAPGFSPALAAPSLRSGQALKGGATSGDQEQSIVPARVTEAVDAQKLILLQGNTHPMARAEFDRGPLPDSQPIRRILLVLQRSPEQETELRRLLEEQQTTSSPNFHHWLTPEELGRRFGPADADIQAVTDWLVSQGFEVSRVAAGRTVIEFSGTAEQVRQAFHTEIHKFVVNDEEHWANTSDPQIPAALAPVVTGFASLNNFPRTPMIRRLGTFQRSRTTGEVKPLFTFPYQTFTLYAVGPTDFATIYNVQPLWKSGIDGTGQTIAIVGETNINIQDVRDFRSMFGLPANDPVIILNGPDPGKIPGEEAEGDLDVQWAGAVAKGATIKFVVSETTFSNSTPGIDLSALYIIDNNLAPVMSESYGACELFLGNGGNAFYNALWEQASAQGITVMISSGDQGSAVCDAFGGIAAQFGAMVSGTASTPFNIAVGGTDFNDTTSLSTYWNSTNSSPGQNSAKSYIPETTWNDTCARSGSLTGCTLPTSTDLVGGSGGRSNCVNSTVVGSSYTCNSGYPKPSWQTGTGTQTDSVRDVPDISLFASDGFNGSFYVICEMDANTGTGSSTTSCDLNSPYLNFQGVGGTSASSPAFAGIMALVNQKWGRQGNANYVLYKLAAIPANVCTSNAAAVTNTSCIFYDVNNLYGSTTNQSNISVACHAGTPNCSNRTSSGYGVLVVNPSASPQVLAWNTTAGYDLATGLGSVNAANLVNNWNTVTFTPSTTTITSFTPTTLTHGQSVNVSIGVAPTPPATGTPTGDVSLIANVSNSNGNSSMTGVGSFKLTSGLVSSTTNLLPGGTYNVTAHYQGDGTFGASDSSPISVTVNKESSQAKVGLVTFDPTSGAVTSLNAATASYGSPYILRVDVTNSSGAICSTSAIPCPTGTVTLTDNGSALDLGTYTLNDRGYFEDQPIQLPGGTHNVVATYSGDISYNASTSPTDAISITKATTTTAVSAPSSAASGASVTLTANIATSSNGAGPTGTVTFLNNGTAIGSPVTVTGTAASYTSAASATASLTTSFTATASITAQYTGDGNYAASTSTASTITISDFSFSASPTSLTVTAGSSGTSTLTITPSGGFTGPVSFSCTGAPAGSTCSAPSATVSSSSSVTSTLTISTTAKVPPLAPERRVPPSFRLPMGLLWLLAGLLALAILLSFSAARRRPAVLLFATVLVVAGIWAACGGGGTPPPPPTAPAVSLSASSLTFSNQGVGTTSGAQTVTLSNTGNAALSISGIAISGTNSGDFAESHTCGSSVAAGSNCTISVTFTPAATGTRTASVAVTDNASGSPHTVSLTGTGTQPTPKGTYTLTVTATSGSTSHNTTVTLTVQ